MAEIATRIPVIAGARYAKGRASVIAAPPAARASLRARADAVPALSNALGLALPQRPKTSVEKGGLRALWLGPDEWFLTGPDGHDFTAAAAKAGVFHSCVDISHRNAALVVEGPGAVDAINAGCPQDLSLAVFPVGACSRSVMGKTEIILLRLAADRFHVEVWRSFAPYAFDFLEDAIKRDC
jgi:sarcosine oxidase subunit gamma